MKEIWKKIPDFEYYEASNLGRIRSIQRIIDYGAKGSRKHPGKIKVQSMSAVSTGSHIAFTLFVCLVRVKGGQKQQISKSVHTLIMLAFVGPRPKGMQILHRDGNAFNNKLTNLKYGTAEENWLDRKRHAKCWKCGARVFNKNGVSIFNILQQQKQRREYVNNQNNTHA